MRLPLTRQEENGVVFSRATLALLPAATPSGLLDAWPDTLGWPLRVNPRLGGYLSTTPLASWHATGSASQGLACAGHGPWTRDGPAKIDNWCRILSNCVERHENCPLTEELPGHSKSLSRSGGVTSFDFSELRFTRSV
jgi:hypothetical protein